MNEMVMPKVRIDELEEDGAVIYRARVQVRGSPRFHTADGKSPSEALLLVAAKWHAWKMS